MMVGCRDRTCTDDLLVMSQACLLLHHSATTNVRRMP